MMNDDNAIGRRLHIRALNHLRRDHPLTYVAARNLSEGIHEDALESWTLDHIKRRVRTGRTPVYWQYSLFKSVDSGGRPEFRNCLIGSPTTHLAEIWTLWRIGQDPAFRVPPSVFSYLWPGPMANQSYRGFLEGYRRRERAIADAAAKLEDPYVVVLDLKQFYPSVDAKLAFERFERRIKNSYLDPQDGEVAIDAAKGICRPRRIGGLPIGPPLAHAIANVFLEDFDDVLGRAFPGRYFRYVDDVALVVERGEVERARATFDRVATSEGLRVNEDKTDVHEGRLWRRHVTSREELDRVDTFGGLITRLTQYLAHNPDDFESVRSMFRDEGFALPFSRVKSVAEYGPFRWLANRAYRALGLLGITRAASPSDLLATAQSLRSQFKDRARRLADADISPDGIERRWAIQHFRFAFNRLLYLLPDGELYEHGHMLPDLEEMAATRVVYDSLVRGDASSLVDFPGPTTTAFCQLWRERHNHLPTFKWPFPTKRHHRDSVITLSLYGLCQPSPDWIEAFDAGHSQPALMLSAGRRPLARSQRDFSYIDEIESLSMTAEASPLQLLATRFDTGEAIELPALDLGNGYAS